MLFVAVKFWRVVEPSTKRLVKLIVPAVRFVNTPLVAKRFVEVALVVVLFVAKRLVVEAVPLTSRLKFADEVLMPTFPFVLMYREFVGALPSIVNGWVLTPVVLS